MYLNGNFSAQSSATEYEIFALENLQKNVRKHKFYVSSILIFQMNCCEINNPLNWENSTFGLGLSTTAIEQRLELNKNGNFSTLPVSCCVGNDQFCRVNSPKAKLAAKESLANL